MDTTALLFVKERVVPVREPLAIKALDAIYHTHHFTTPVEKNMAARGPQLVRALTLYAGGVCIHNTCGEIECQGNSGALFFVVIQGEYDVDNGDEVVKVHGYKKVKKNMRGLIAAWP
jgi:hypothetical protein